jgi:hypothetical protein
MKNGSVYVAVVVAALVGYFAYQWWFNPSRAVKRRLGEVAATVSVPDRESEVARVARVAELGRYLANDIRVRADGTEIVSRDALIAAIAALHPPPGGWDVQFIDVQIALDSSSAARASLTVEIHGREPGTGETTPDVIDVREAVVTMRKQNREWLVAGAEAKPKP